MGDTPVTPAEGLFLEADATPARRAARTRRLRGKARLDNRGVSGFHDRNACGPPGEHHGR